MQKHWKSCTGRCLHNTQEQPGREENSAATNFKIINFPLSLIPGGISQGFEGGIYINAGSYSSKRRLNICYFLGKDLNELQVEKVGVKSLYRPFLFDWRLETLPQSPFSDLSLCSTNTLQQFALWKYLIFMNKACRDPVLCPNIHFYLVSLALKKGENVKASL